MPQLKAPNLLDFPHYWAECYGTAPFLPMSRTEMDDLGWDSCDIILVCGDAYVDHPSFGMAIIGRLLESQGYRVGLICQPDWQTKKSFEVLGRPNLFFAVSAGNMDSMINRYTADKRIRHDDAYTPAGIGGKRPDRAVIVYSQKCREAFTDVPIVIGGIEASLRRIAQYDYWSDEVRRSVLIDSAADILIYGNAERPLLEVALEYSRGKTVKDMQTIRGTVVVKDNTPGNWIEIDSTRIDWPGNINAIANPYDMDGSCSVSDDKNTIPIRIIPQPLQNKITYDKSSSYIRIPSFEKLSGDSVLYAHASRVLHQESNPHNALTLVQKHGCQEIWVNPPAIPLTTEELDFVFALPFQRIPHPSYREKNIPAYEMIRFSVNIMRGCFGGCTFCSITEHEGRIIQSRSEQSILQEIEDIRDKVPGFTGAISDLGGPTANMYQLNCADPNIQSTCRRLSCVYPEICVNLKTDHTPTTELYRNARALPGVKRILIASGLRYDLAVHYPEYVRELVNHHVGGYLKIAPEHTETSTLSLMMKPDISTYHQFQKMFNQYSKEVDKKQYLIPYFIAAHPGCTEEEMLNLALWLKRNKLRVDQVQNFYPSPMSLATAMYHSKHNPLKKVSYKNVPVYTARTIEERRLQKAILRYHDEKQWSLLRDALKKLKRSDLIGDNEKALIPDHHKKTKTGPSNRPVRKKQRHRPRGR
ncbi:MAG: YgiQ family radical SAM protein [Gammaproteobacteria bacterium]|nr:YgiQ family radical SAM protein [Gammaproteobacteria bacterium]